MTVAHPIAQAWLSTGDELGQSTGAPNYDEFADDAEITAIIAANPASALAVEMPHRAPGATGGSLSQCLPEAVARLAAQKAAGRYAPAPDVAVLYRIAGPDTPPAYGLWCMIDTAEISTSAAEPGAVIRNEDVFQTKVSERVALAKATGHLLSPVLLLQTTRGEELNAALADAIDAAGAPVVVDVDSAGRRHEIWPIGPGTTRDRLLALAGDGELVVADGNHRSLAAQTAELRRFLAVVTTSAAVSIQPYNRLVSELPMTPAELVNELVAAGAEVAPLAAPGGSAPRRGTVIVYTRDGAWSVTLPVVPDADPVDNLDHALVERRLFAEALGLDPGDKRIAYVGGDYPARWLFGEVDSGRAELAVLVAPVTVDDFVAVNLARRKMPRKSTWFTPKARAGLVAVELGTGELGHPSG